MSNNNFYIKIVVLLSVFLLTGASGVAKINQEIKNDKFEKIVLSKIRVESSNKEKVEKFNLDFELKSFTIKENETYGISDFISDTDEDTLKNISYYYKDEIMSSYKEVGNHDIVIVFKNAIGSKIEKQTTLTIEKKENNNSENISTRVQTLNDITKMDIETQILTNNKNIGTSGRLYFSSMYSVALYQPTTSEEAQRIVDNSDSASFIPHSGYNIIADHSYQGFDIIKTQNVGNYVYIKKSNYVLEKYVIREKTNGKNVGYDLITNDNRSIADDVNCSLVLYTCNSTDGLYVTILILDRIS